MTAALSLIKTELGRGATDFIVPADRLVRDDLHLVTERVLEFNGKYRKHLHCAECGATGDVTVHKMGASTSYTFLCPSCDVLEDKEIPPANVELLDFNYRRFFLYVSDRSVNDGYVDEAAKCLPSRGLGNAHAAFKSEKSPLQTALEALMAIVDDACANPKDGEFLFKRQDFAAVVEGLWNNHTSEEYAVSQPEVPVISSLWREIRLKLIEYAKCMVSKPHALIKALADEKCWMLFPKFTTIGEKPHVLDTGTMKELFATLQIQETPRKTIKTKVPSKTNGEISPEETVDADSLPKKDYRFAMSKDYRTVVDMEHGLPDYEISAYAGLPPTAASIVKDLISSASLKRTEGWCRPQKNWRGAFQNGVAKRFKHEQIEIRKRHGWLSHWRIIRTEEFHQHYNCKIKPRPKSF